MVSRRWFVMAIVLMVGVISGCNVFWEGASASSQITQSDVPDEGDTSSEDGAVHEDGPDVLTGDATSPVDRVFTEVGDASSDDVLMSQDVVTTDVVRDEGLTPVDLPTPEDVTDVTDTGIGPDTGVDIPVSEDVLMIVDVGRDAGAPDVGFDATSVATDGGDAGPSDTGIDTGPICPSGQMLCGGACVNTATSADHCGACSINCPVPVFPNMVRACQSGQCGAVCVTGFANCDGLMGNGCEVDTRVTAQHCGACSRSCSLANATPTCLGGSCYITSCATGFANCDGNEANGCETDTRSNTQHCGACGRVCAPMMHGSVACVNAQCTVTCNEGALLEGGLCVQKDLIIEYTHWGPDRILVPRNTSYVGFFTDGIILGFSDEQYAMRMCDSNPVPIDTYRWRCSIARLTEIQRSSLSLLLSLRVRCGQFRDPDPCPARWNEHWRIIFRGRVYDHPSDTGLFTGYNACPYSGWSAGCVHLQLAP